MKHYLKIFNEPGLLLQSVNTKCPSENVDQNINGTLETFLMKFTVSAGYMSNTLYIETTEGRYQDIWYNAKIYIEQTYNKCIKNLGFPDKFCFGANTDKSLKCDSADNKLEIYENY